MTSMRTETDSLGKVEVPGDKLWGAQTQRSLEHFSIGRDLIPREMITAYATLKKAAATANHASGRLDEDAGDGGVLSGEKEADDECQRDSDTTSQRDDAPTRSQPVQRRQQAFVLMSHCFYY